MVSCQMFSRHFRLINKFYLNTAQKSKFCNMEGLLASKPARNVEIKAKIDNKEEFERKLQIAKELSGSDGTLIVQHDVFFNSENGRLKLRYLKDKASELIYYARPDTIGPKLSEYHKIDIAEPETLETILKITNGVKGVVDKTRHLYLYGQTRLHMDNVKDLGYFLEFEVVLKDEESLDDGQKIAEDLMKKFGLSESDLIVGAYMDKLLEK